MTLENTSISRRAPPDLIPGYRLESLLGKGGMGEVHKAVQLSLGRTVAVKLLSADLAGDRTFVTRFEKEAAALAALSHPHIVAIVDKGKAGKTYYLVMEFVDGQSLREVMRSPSYDPTEALKLAFDVCRAIDYAHGRGVIHRDLKPENILIDEQAGGIPKVSDFGLANFIEDGPSRFNLTETHVAMGTQAYMAPEQRVDAKSADHRADVYSLGVMLYELVVGEVPVGNFDPPSQRKPNLDPRLDAIVARCLKTSPSERYQKVSELISDLLPLVPVSFSRPPSQANPIDRMRWWVRKAVRTATRAVALGVVALACGVLGLSWIRSHEAPAPITLADALAPALTPKTTATVSARISEAPELRRVQLGEGPDRVSLVGAGRAVALAGSTLAFAPPSSDAMAGRTLLDLTDLGGHQVELLAEVKAGPAHLGWWTRLRGWVLKTRFKPRAAVALQGTPGRYVAVILDGRGGPALLEWALGERRGTFIGTSASPRTRVELTVDRTGELRAYLSSGEDRRELGEPILLGTGWRKYFGRTPTAELACIEGACEVSGLDYAVRREPPPPAAAPEPPPPPKVVSVKAVTRPVVKKPVHAVAPKATSHKHPAYPPAKKKPVHRR